MMPIDPEAERLGTLSQGEWRLLQLRQFTSQGDDLKALRAGSHETRNYLAGQEGLLGRVQKAIGLLDAVGRQVGITAARGNPTALSLFHAPTGLVEVGYSGLLVAMGLALLAPDNTFGSGATFRVMASLLPETVWGALLLVAGLFCGAALFLGPKSFRRLGAFVATILLGVMAVGFFLSNPAGVAYLQTGLPLAGSIWVLIWGARP